MRQGGSWATLSLRDAGPSSRWISAVASVTRPARTRQVASCISSRHRLILRPRGAVTADRGGDSAKRSTEKWSTSYPFLTGVTACRCPMLHRRAPYIARIFEISIEMLQCNKSERAAKRCCSLNSVECLNSQRTVWAPQKLNSQNAWLWCRNCRPAGSLSWTIIGRACAENEACPVTGGQHCRLGRNYHLRPAPTYVVPQRFHFPLVGPEAIPQCYFFAI